MAASGRNFANNNETEFDDDSSSKRQSKLDNFHPVCSGDQESVQKETSSRDDSRLAPDSVLHYQPSPNLGCDPQRISLSIDLANYPSIFHCTMAIIPLLLSLSAGVSTLGVLCLYTWWNCHRVVTQKVHNHGHFLKPIFVCTILAWVIGAVQLLFLLDQVPSDQMHQCRFVTVANASTTGLSHYQHCYYHTGNDLWLLHKIGCCSETEMLRNPLSSTQFGCSNWVEAIDKNPETHSTSCVFSVCHLFDVGFHTHNGTISRLTNE